MSDGTARAVALEVRDLFDGVDIEEFRRRMRNGDVEAAFAMLDLSPEQAKKRVEAWDRLINR